MRRERNANKREGGRGMFYPEWGEPYRYSTVGSVQLATWECMNRRTYGRSEPCLIPPRRTRMDNENLCAMWVFGVWCLVVYVCTAVAGSGAALLHIPPARWTSFPMLRDPRHVV